MNTPNSLRTLGILGGMGPLATVDFMQKIIALTPAEEDQQHIPLIVHSVPQIPDRSSAIIANTDAPFLPMLEGLRQLERCGVEAVLIPCNTAHFWHERLSQATHLPILHIVDAVTHALAQQQITPAACMLLATRGTRQAGIYQRANNAMCSGFQLPNEAEQAQVDNMIHFVKQGKLSLAQQSGAALINTLRQKGVQRVVLACTELPLAMEPTQHPDYFINATLALAQSAVHFALQQQTGTVV
ncbi:aspartate/glutamate racemase family protein [Alcaligenes endophyticus]|uniref:Amino acid racemase n=1 Tax=Alcaligenes endophyticus TaxID=1929088 RepID=A0ABT8EJV2_9BURK|nr:amino acid racemase [Alcaligenes endophyticus]MCX5591833.1 amino acid racemase [Alcaligenes endophyticus]MDN4121510.1 amino acid racemase [Alcaligenes endophyticus]